MDNAVIFDLYRGTTHDGPGVRDTVFFQGCPLACAWCHNPEGIATQSRVWWDDRACIGCVLCRDACQSGAIQPSKNGILLDDSRCSRCGACVRACPSGAIAFVAREWTMEELLDEVLRDKPYYLRTGGGVTASGGECMLQPAFVTRLFTALRASGVSTALDTSGCVPWISFEQVLPHTDFVLYDLKLWDGALHRQFTGQGNTLILENARRIAQAVVRGKYQTELWVRTPLIPGATATPENLAALGKFIVEELHGAVARWELCAFNNSCITKYERLQMRWPYRDIPLLRADEALTLRTAAISGGVPEACVAVTGLLSE